ncbi:hypothetical protein, partial [Ligilactobacillus equi]|uniref:hypothetical protein n=1 Tax=Ligilactobacillus equi TaxID=137357 RepID=UPI000556F43D
MKNKIVKKKRTLKLNRAYKGVATGAAVALGTFFVSVKANADEVANTATPTTPVSGSGVNTSVNATGSAAKGDGTNVVVNHSSLDAA